MSDDCLGSILTDTHEITWGKSYDIYCLRLLLNVMRECQKSACNGVCGVQMLYIMVARNPYYQNNLFLASKYQKCSFTRFYNVAVDPFSIGFH